MFASTIAVGLSWILLLFGRSFISNFIGVNENFYLKYYYDIVNGKNYEKKSNNIPEHIRIINLEKYRSRQDQVRILDKVYNLNPSVIGLDVFFENNPDISSDINNKLIETVRKIKDKTVFPCDYSTDKKGIVYTKFPFFKNELGLEEITYSSTLANDFYGYYQIDDSSIPHKDTESPILPMMSIEIARKSKFPMAVYSGDFYVNYAKKDFLNIIIEDTLELVPVEIQDKVVLIGDLSDEKDMRNLPFKFGEKNAISGVEDIAYSLISILKNERTNFDSHMRFRGFKDWPLFLSYLLSLILTFLFCWLTRWYEKKKEKETEKNKFRAIVAVLFQPLLFVIGEILVILICYGITTWNNTIPDLFVCMVSLALVNVSIELTNLIFHKR